ncbi:MAG: HAD-IA family hydrolase [Candidatus Diapherotrites archaeon]
MIKVVFFDLDNTLIDFMRMKKLSCDAALDAMISFGLNMSKPKARKLLFELYGEQGIEHQHIFQDFLKKYCGTVDYRMLSAAITSYRRVQLGFLEPYPSVRQTLVKLKEMNLRLGIVSDAPRLKAWMRLTEMNLSEFFEEVITLDDSGALKPDPKPFEMALKKFNIASNEVIFVGDNPERDIKGANIAGFYTALAEYGQTIKSKNNEPNFVLKKPSDLINVIEKINKH